jgi:Tfp pilus assembly protein PilZ
MDGTTYRGISSNLSLNGLFIRTRKPFTADTVINLIVHFPNGSTSKLKGITRRAVRNPVRNQINGMGIEIIEKDSNYFDFVNSIVSLRE